MSIGKTLLLITGIGAAMIILVVFITRPQVSDYRLKYFNREQPYVAGERYWTVKGHRWAFDKKTYERLAKAVTADDKKTIKRMLDSQEIHALRAGVKVRLVRREWGIAEVQPEGETYTFWTSVEALKK